MPILANFGDAIIYGAPAMMGFVHLMLSSDSASFSGFSLWLKFIPGLTPSCSHVRNRLASSASRSQATLLPFGFAITGVSMCCRTVLRLSYESLHDGSDYSTGPSMNFPLLGEGI